MTLGKRRLRNVTIGLAMVFLVQCLIMFSIQNWMIFPGHSTQGQPDAVVPSSPEYELVHLTTADGESVVAIFGFANGVHRSAAGEILAAPTVLFFYGNGMCMADCVPEFRRFRKLGANVMVMDYPGYGMSGGTSSERSLYAAADAAYDYLAHRPDIDNRKIIAAGWSLGAAVAMNVAGHHPVAGLATFSAFTSMPDMAQGLIPWLPTSLLLRSRFDNLEKIKLIHCPIFIAHGTHDTVVPFPMSKRLIAAAGGPVTSLEVNSNHNDIFDSGGDAIDKRLGEFLAQFQK